MDSIEKERLNREKNIKSKLAHTRKVIKKKFRKAYKKRIRNERKLTEKYRPVTRAIEKLREQQEKILVKPLIEKHSAKIKPPKLGAFGEWIESDDSNVPSEWEVTEIDDLHNEKRDQMQDLQSTDYDSDVDMVDSFDQKPHAVHHDTADFSAAQHFDDFDNADGAGSANATAVAIPSTPHKSNPRNSPLKKQRYRFNPYSRNQHLKLNTRDPRLMPRIEHGPMELIEDRMKREREQAEASGDGKRIKMSNRLLGVKNIAKYRNRFQIKDIENARKLREAASTKARIDARNKPLQLIVSNEPSTSSASTPTIDESNHDDVADLTTSDEDEDEDEFDEIQDVDEDDRTKDDDDTFVKQSGFRMTLKRRKPQEFVSNKFVKVPAISDIERKLRSKYGLPKKTPASLMKQYTKRSFPSQQTPYNIETPIPSITLPYLTKEGLLYRLIKPAEPENTSVLGEPKSKEVKNRKDKLGSGIETEFIPYNENVAYVFYDDPNELCDRLRALLASRAAGNMNHVQEINSLIAELRESGYIK